MKPILEIKSLSKRFKIQHQESYLSLRDKITGLLMPSRPSEDFWAIKDISFNVEAGESVGIIGRNGAGKSTLLKILSKITPPTSGQIICRGRVASLLEVGTGFHPELTGRENIFLNGSILGMKRHEIRKHFDAIIEFAGTEKFLDTPLKHYSSGMQLRLAFSVAAFLEPEVLVIDEVLAVGDAEFQKKCLGKMEEVSKSGRTVLFVSHNMAAVNSLCSSAVLIDKGSMVMKERTQDVITAYESIVSNTAGNHTGIIFLEPKNGVVKRVEIFCDDRLSSTAYMGCKLEIKIHFSNDAPLEFPVLGLIFKDSQNSPLLAINNKHYVGNLIKQPLRDGSISMTIPHLPFFEGNYFVDVHMGNAFKDLQVIRECFQLTVEPMKFSSIGEWPDKQYNKIFVKDVAWSVNDGGHD